MGEKKRQRQKNIAMVVSVLVGAVCGVMLAGVVRRFAAATPLTSVAFVLSTYAAFVLHILIHEAGHLVFGLLTGYQFSSFRIFSFMWLKEDGKLKLKRHSLAGTGGQCLMAPPDMVDGKLPVFWYNMGGSLLNLLVSLIALSGYALFPDASYVAPALAVFSVIGIMTALLNGVPMRMGTVDNDGYNAVALAKDPPAQEAFWVQLKVAEQCAKGVRLKDMPAEWFAVPADEDMTNSMVAARGVFACNRLMDAESFEEADKLMAHLLALNSGMVGLHRSLLICDRIYVALLKNAPRETVEAMLTKEQRKFMKAMKRNPSVLRTEYALALLFENRSEKAEKLQSVFDAVAKTYPYPQEIEAERNLMRNVQHRC